MPSWGVEILADTATPALRQFAGELQEAARHKLQFGASADYASFVEFGTRHMVARSFIRPAFDANQQKLLDAMLVGALNGTMVGELDVVGADMVDHARSIVPVRSGFLRDSIFHAVA